MFDGLLKSKFYSKSKSNINMLKKRLEVIRKKKGVVLKYLKNDIADLLRNGLDINAYGRAEGLLVEQNMSSCYEFIEKFCGCISTHLSAMHKQSGCPEECKEAVPSLMYAAARFSDLPELRDLRSMFTERYGNSLESYINKEFVERLRSNPPTKEMKIQLLQDIAQESNIGWNSKGLEQKLYTTAPKQDHLICVSLSNIDDEKWQKNKDDAVPERDNQNAGNRPSNGKGSITKTKDNGHNFHERKDDIDDRHRMPSSSEEEGTTDLSQDGLKTSSRTVGSVSTDEVEKETPLHYKLIPPPYLKKKADKNKSSPEEPSTKLEVNVDMEAAQHTGGPVVEDKPKPRSVRRRNLKLQPDAVDSDSRDAEERKLDGHLMQYNKKQSPLESGKTKTYLKPPPSQQRDHEYGEYRRNRIKSDSDVPPVRTASLPLEPTLPEATKKHARTTSLQPEMLSMAGHVHPKLPEYDDLAARIAALKGR
ncbi:hypothetical protein FH972_002076 [Carpinus fangiana]|uniref:IST1-like protein n=1 Tax=Carpinus fangiana TaxID=176857 RepID=A0A5N6QDR3_9ROSI|nr:hypothetical protein FH972_002076 [Carpinus fangiana]